MKKNDVLYVLHASSCVLFGLILKYLLFLGLPSEEDQIFYYFREVAFVTVLISLGLFITFKNQEKP